MANQRPAICHLYSIFHATNPVASWGHQLIKQPIISANANTDIKNLYKMKGAGKNVRKTAPKNRKTKVNLVFNEQNRRDFLSGFRNRKLARKQRAKEQLTAQLKAEKKRMKNERRELLKKFKMTCRGVPEVEHIVEPVTYELPNHTVTISTITDVDFQGESNVRLGQNKIEDEEEEPKDLPRDNTLGQNIPKLLRTMQLNQLRNSKAFNQMQKLKQHQDKKKAAKKKHVLKKREDLKAKGKKKQNHKPKTKKR